MNAYFYTLGCKVNQYETQAMRQDLEAHGYQTHEFCVGQEDVGHAVIVINSCTVTGESDRKLRQLLRRCRRARCKRTASLAQRSSCRAFRSVRCTAIAAFRATLTSSLAARPHGLRNATL